MELQSEKPLEQVTAKLMDHNKDLTREGLCYVQGKEPELLERLSKKTGRPVKVINKWIESVSLNE